MAWGSTCRWADAGQSVRKFVDFAVGSGYERMEVLRNYRPQYYEPKDMKSRPQR